MKNYSVGLLVALCFVIFALEPVACVELYRKAAVDFIGGKLNVTSCFIVLAIATSIALAHLIKTASDLRTLCRIDV